MERIRERMAQEVGGYVSRFKTNLQVYGRDLCVKKFLPLGNCTQ